MRTEILKSINKIHVPICHVFVSHRFTIPNQERHSSELIEALINSSEQSQPAFYHTQSSFFVSFYQLFSSVLNEVPSDPYHLQIDARNYFNGRSEWTNHEVTQLCLLLAFRRNGSNLKRFSQYYCITNITKSKCCKTC